MDLKQRMTEHMRSIFPGLMGIELGEVTKERVTASMKVRPDLCTGGRILHGGAIMAFADTLGAIGTVVNMPEGARTATIESKTNFVGGAGEGRTVSGESTPLHRGRTTQVWQTRVTGEDGKLVAIVTQTQIVMRR